MVRGKRIACGVLGINRRPHNCRVKSKGRAEHMGEEELTDGLIVQGESLNVIIVL